MGKGWVAGGLAFFHVCRYGVQVSVGAEAA